MDSTLVLTNKLKFDFITTYVLNRAKVNEKPLNGIITTKEAIRAWEQIQKEMLASNF